MSQTREQIIHITYKSAVRSRKNSKDQNPELLAIVDTAEKLKMSALKVLSVIKAFETK